MEWGEEMRTGSIFHLTILLLTSCLLLAGFGCGRGASEGIKAITVQRRGRYGFCPTYTITVHGDGRVEYEGKHHVDRIGKYMAKQKIPANDFQRLSAMITRLGFSRLNEQYSPGVVDAEQVSVIVTGQSSTKSVRSFVFQDAPIELWSVVVLVDGIAANLEWQTR